MAATQNNSAKLNAKDAAVCELLSAVRNCLHQICHGASKDAETPSSSWQAYLQEGDCIVREPIVVLALGKHSFSAARVGISGDQYICGPVLFEVLVSTDGVTNSKAENPQYQFVKRREENRWGLGQIHKKSIDHWKEQGYEVDESLMSVLCEAPAMTDTACKMMHVIVRQLFTQSMLDDKRVAKCYVAAPEDCRSANLRRTLDYASENISRGVESKGHIAGLLKNAEILCQPKPSPVFALLTSVSKLPQDDCDVAFIPDAKHVVVGTMKGGEVVCSDHREYFEPGRTVAVGLITEHEFAARGYRTFRDTTAADLEAIAMAIVQGKKLSFLQYGKQLSMLNIKEKAVRDTGNQIARNERVVIRLRKVLAQLCMS